MYVGMKLRQIRESIYKENARDFAKRCGISKSCLLQLERGEVIKTTKVIRNKIEKALSVDFDEISNQDNYVFKKSQKDKRFVNVFEAICRDIKKSISLLDGLCNEKYYLRNDELIDQRVDTIIKLIEDERNKLKSTCILTKEERAFLFIDEAFKSNKVEVIPPRKKEEI